MLNKGEHKSEIGGKAKGLIFLRQSGLKTPEFHILSYDTLKSAAEREDSFESSIEQWLFAHKLDKNKWWAVRSSAAAEDGHEKSFAGQYQTKLNIPFNSIPSAVKEVLDSYQRKSGYSENATKFGIIVQEMLHPDFSGVIFSRDPIKPYSKEPVISIIPGLGEKLVSGEMLGYQINFKNKKPHFPDSADDVEGEHWTEGGQLAVKASVSEIKTSISPHIKTILSEIERLENIKGTALDFEFVIQNGILYWLQVRPITTRKLDASFIIWDNTSVEANYPGITLPLSISFIRKTFFKAYYGGAKSLGFSSSVLDHNKVMFENMCGEIDGGLYYNVTAWQSLLYQMPFGAKLSRKLPEIWGMEDTDFIPPGSKHSAPKKAMILFRLVIKLLRGSALDKKYQQLYNDTLSTFNNADLKSENFHALKERYKKIESDLGDNWLAPVLNGFYTMMVYGMLKRKVNRSRIYSDFPNFVNDILFSDGEVISVKLVKDFQNLLTNISSHKELKTLFEADDEDKILEELRMHYPDFHKQLIGYIKAYGNRTDQGELKLETVSYQQDPKLFIHYLKSNLKGFVLKEEKQERFNYRLIVKKYYPYNFIQRMVYFALIKSVSKRMRIRENYRFMRTNTFAMIRLIFLQMGEVLAQESLLDHPRDIFYLTLEELLDTEHAEFRNIIASRQQKYSIYRSINRPNRYIGMDDVFYPIEDDVETVEGDQLKGIGCCSGLVEGRVIVIDNDTNFDQDFSGYILVAKFFEPGWISLFYQAKGIISERGNLLSHTAIICRELNVPSIVGVKGLTKKIANGDFIEMNGATGMVKIQAHE